ncbi:MAG: hypothetical protein ACTXOO_05890 [Sodalis sp. (in: enterobacteria)]
MSGYFLAIDCLYVIIMREYPFLPQPDASEKQSFHAGIAAASKGHHPQLPAAALLERRIKPIQSSQSSPVYASIR